jgi:pentatricopeptide repeat protein
MIAFGFEPNAKSWDTLLFLMAAKGKSSFFFLFFLFLSSLLSFPSLSSRLLHPVYSPSTLTLLSILNSHFYLYSDMYACAKLFDEMRRKGIAHYKSTYDVLLRIYGKQGLLKTCDKLVAQMANSGISRDANTFNILIEGHAAKGALTQCASLMAEMRAQGIAPDMQTYTTFMQACAKHEKYAEGIEAYVRMRSERVAANVLTYRAALACFAGMHEWDACVNLTAHMEAQVFNYYTYRFLFFAILLSPFFSFVFLKLSLLYFSL